MNSDGRKQIPSPTAPARKEAANKHSAILIVKPSTGANALLLRSQAAAVGIRMAPLECWRRVETESLRIISQVCKSCSRVVVFKIVVITNVIKQSAD